MSDWKIQNIERNCSLIAETFMVLLGSLLLQHHIFISEAVVEQTAWVVEEAT